MDKEQESTFQQTTTEEELSLTKELKILADANLIPADLLESSKQNELHDFVRKNKDILRSSIKNLNNDLYSTKMRPQIESDSAYELQVIDKRTGQIILKD